MTFALALAAVGASPAQAQGDSCATQNPVVFSDGLFRTRFFAPVLDSLRDCGATVFETSVSPTDNSMNRGMELLDQIREILAMTGAEKVNLIVHSQGSFDGGFVNGTAPEVLASFTTLAGLRGPGDANGPGSPAADLGLTLGPAIARNLLSGQVGDIGGDPGNDAGFARALQTLSRDGAREFNRMFPEGVPTQVCGEGEPMVNGVLLQSFGGVAIRTNQQDPGDAALALGAAPFAGEPSDGLVGVCASHFGRVRDDSLNANHLDFQCQANNLTAPDFPCESFMRMIVTELAQMGL